MSQGIPRLSAPDLVPELREMLRAKMDRLGYLGEFFQCMAHQPQVLMSFIALTEELKQALPNPLTEVVALSVAALLKNDYERVQHERLSLKLGFGEPWVRGVLSLQPDGRSSLGEEDRLVQKLVIAVIRNNGRDSDQELEAVVSATGHEKAVAVLMLIGRYAMHALIANCLKLAPPVSSPLETT
jgi:alkylhydroperoxidase family enzyme